MFWALVKNPAVVLLRARGALDNLPATARAGDAGNVGGRVAARGTARACRSHGGDGRRAPAAERELRREGKRWEVGGVRGIFLGFVRWEEWDLGGVGGFGKFAHIFFGPKFCAVWSHKSGPTGQWDLGGVEFAHIFGPRGQWSHKSVGCAVLPPAFTERRPYRSLTSTVIYRSSPASPPSKTLSPASPPSRTAAPPRRPEPPRLPSVENRRAGCSLQVLPYFSLPSCCLWRDLGRVWFCSWGFR